MEHVLDDVQGTFHVQGYIRLYCFELRSQLAAERVALQLLIRLP